MAASTYVANEVKPGTAVLKELYDLLVRKVPDYKSNKYLKKNFKARKLAKWLGKRPRLALWALRRQNRKKK